ncbi:hypothetical protein H9P43_005708 [Blastocladiella emersonii ATCC 22665]|nr:hypothetical protein H9P43_005708 [Blastocladiella emersonii ATCC 22665]
MEAGEHVTPAPDELLRPASSPAAAAAADSLYSHTASSPAPTTDSLYPFSSDHGPPTRLDSPAVHAIHDLPPEELPPPDEDAGDESEPPDYDLSSDSEVDDETQELIDLELRRAAMNATPAPQPEPVKQSPERRSADLDTIAEEAVVPAPSDPAQAVAVVGEPPPPVPAQDRQRSASPEGEPIRPLSASAWTEPANASEPVIEARPVKHHGKHEEELMRVIDQLTPEIIAASQLRSERVFKVEQASLLLAAERRASHEATTKFHTRRRELNTLTDAAETHLRVRLEAERDRTTAYTLRAAYMAAALRKLRDGAVQGSKTARAVAAAANTRTHEARTALGPLQARLLETERAVLGLEAAYRRELDRGATLRRMIDERDEAARRDREKRDRANRAPSARAWHVDIRSSAASTVKPVAVAVRNGEDRPTTAMELDISGFDNLKLVGASRLGVDEVRGLERNSNTYAIDLSENRIRDIEFLNQAPKLKILNLRSNQITNTRILDDLSGLMWLDLSHNPMLKTVDLPAQFFFLVVLNLSHCALERIPELNLPVLNYLDVSANRLTELAVATWLPLLQTLLADDNGIQTIWPLDNCPMLERLSLRNNRVHAVRELLSLVTCTELKLVPLDGNQVATSPDQWIVSSFLPWLDLDGVVAERQVAGDNHNGLLYRVLLGALYGRYNKVKDPVRPGDAEMLEQVLNDAAQLAIKMGDIHVYFRDVMQILSNSPSEQKDPPPTAADGVAPAATTTVPPADDDADQGPDAAAAAAMREAHAYSQLTALCRLCLDGNLPDCSHAVYHAARGKLFDAFAPLHMTRFQAQCRGFLVRHWVGRAIVGAVLIQRAFRDYRVRKALAEERRRAAAATRIQAVWRAHRVRRIVDFIRGRRDLHTPPDEKKGAGEDSDLEDLGELGDLEPTADLDVLFDDSVLKRLDAVLEQFSSRDDLLSHVAKLPQDASPPPAPTTAWLTQTLDGTAAPAPAASSLISATTDDDEAHAAADHTFAATTLRGHGDTVPKSKFTLDTSSSHHPHAPRRSRTQTSELASRNAGRHLAGLGYGLGARMAAMLGGLPKMDVIGARRVPNETVKLIQSRRRQMEVYAKQVIDGPSPEEVAARKLEGVAAKRRTGGGGGGVLTGLPASLAAHEEPRTASAVDDGVPGVVVTPGEAGSDPAPPLQGESGNEPSDPTLEWQGHKRRASRGGGRRRRSASAGSDADDEDDDGDEFAHLPPLPEGEEDELAEEETTTNAAATDPVLETYSGETLLKTEPKRRMSVDGTMLEEEDDELGDLADEQPLKWITTIRKNSIASRRASILARAPGASRRASIQAAAVSTAASSAAASETQLFSLLRPGAAVDALPIPDGVSVSAIAPATTSCPATPAVLPIPTSPGKAQSPLAPLNPAAPTAKAERAKTPPPPIKFEWDLSQSRIGALYQSVVEVQDAVPVARPDLVEQAVRRRAALARESTAFPPVFPRATVVAGGRAVGGDKSAADVCLDRDLVGHLIRFGVPLHVDFGGASTKADAFVPRVAPPRKGGGGQRGSGGGGGGANDGGGGKGRAAAFAAAVSPPPPPRPGEVV